MFQRDKLYHRRQDLHAKYGGQRQGGISCPKNHPIILLFTGNNGRQYGYEDNWTTDRRYLYTGEGQYGDMSFTRGNKAILNHQETGKEIHLFKQAGKGMVSYVGEMVCTDHQVKTSHDADGHQRKIIVFTLTSVEEVTRGKK